MPSVTFDEDWQFFSKAIMCWVASKCQTRLPQKGKNISLFSVGGILKKFFDERCAGEKDLIELVLENYNLVLPDFLY
jgi:hypothetical protein